VTTEHDIEEPVEYPRYCWVMFVMGIAAGLLVSKFFPGHWFGA
jgi:hypothetical protein